MTLKKLFALAGICCALLVAKPHVPATAGAFFVGDGDKLYVVIGAFSVPGNASKFQTQVKQRYHLNAKIDFNPIRKLYYVYVLNTGNREAAIAEARRLREQQQFQDAWVFQGALGNEQAVAAAPGQDIHPETGESMTSVPAAASEPTSTPAAPVEMTASLVSTPSLTTTESAEPAYNPQVIKPTYIEGTSRKFFFNLFKSSDYDTIHGEVEVIDPDKTRKIGTYDGNRAVKVPVASVKSGNVTFVSKVFGYRKTQRDINVNDPSGDGVVQDEDGSIVIPFEMVRLQKGDISVMYNVYFFKDAAIMRPESRYEVNSLVEMMKENERYKIVIHGHTNGGAAGKILEYDPAAGNFFSLSGAKEGFGSAKELSEERAELIREYLIKNGIAADRMQVKAWGGKRPIFDKHSNRAQENVRVEVEILEN